MNSQLDFNFQHEAGKAAIGAGGAVLSAVTLNTIVTVLTILYLLVVLWNATPKAVATFKHWREVCRNKRRKAEGGTGKEDTE